jgi:hypothetical protein
MRKFQIFSLALCLLSINIARADEILTTVFNIVESKKTDHILILSGVDGRVYKYRNSERNLKFVKKFIGQVVKLNFYNVSGENYVRDILYVNRRDVDSSEYDLNKFKYNELREFAPTDLRSEENVSLVFDNLLNDGDKSRSQCFKRAHMWAYDMWSKLNINSQKIFIFYTQRYIQLEDFEWWFHVAPMVTSNGREFVLDGTFMDKPVTVEQWQHRFIQSENITCPVIENYKTYDDNQFKRLCYLMKVPMHYFSPLDIENRDLNGVEKNQWELEELQDARRAFKNYDERYEALDSGKPTITH